MPKNIPKRPADAGRRKRIRKPRLETDGKLWPFLDALSDAVLVVNGEGRVLYLNAVGEGMFGYNRDELLDQPVETLLPERLRKLHPTLLGSYFKNPQPRSMGTGLDLVGGRKDGTEFPVDISLSPIKWRGKVVAVATVREMTERLETLTRLLKLANDAIMVLDMNGTISYWNEGAERLYGWTSQEAQGKTMSALLHTAFPAPPEEIFDLLLREGHWEGELVQTCHEGMQIVVSSHCTLQRRKDGEPVAILDISSDITKRKQAETNVRSLLQISELLHSTLDINALMDTLVIEGMKLVDAQAGFAGLRTPAGMVCQKYFRGSEIIPFDYCWPPGNGLPGWVMIHKVPYVTNDAQNDGQISPALIAKFRWSSAISTPVLDRHGEAMGFFEFFDKKHGFTKADVEKLLAVDRTASIAIENAVAYRKVQDAEAEVRRLTAHMMRLQDEERRNLARALHETTAQGLASLKMNLDLLNKSRATPDMKTREILSESLSLADQCTQEVRTLSYLLHPPLLDEMGLTAALRWFTSGFTDRSGIQVKLDVAPDLERFSQEVETMLFRIVQECLTNIHRHSGSPAATIRISSGAGGLFLEVEDAGRGMPSRALEGGVLPGVGIAGMRERLKQFGGRLEIHSSGKGTTVKAFLPRPPNSL